MDSKLNNLYKHPLIKLGGDKYPEYEGIYSPNYDEEEIKQFMTDYYNTLESVREQATRINLTKYYHRLIKEALKKSNFNRLKDHLKILDVGCGFGSTTFPLLKIFSNANVIASELSLPMLLILKEKLAVKDKPRIEFLQLNAEKLDFKENSFDLICGAAILHHLFSPEKTIKDVSDILKPGGIAIFFEPFEEGMSIMGLIYQTIIYHGKFKWLGHTTKVYFRNMVELWDKMKNMDKGDDFFETVDDKWLFQKEYFYKLAKKYSLDCQIYRLDKSDKPYTHIYESHLGSDAKKLPYWIREVITKYENWLSKDAKDNLLTEGCIIFKKSK